jgi:hypothetical protein
MGARGVASRSVYNAGAATPKTFCPPYRRREPVEAHEYFRQVGLRGEFWGLDQR